MVNKAVSKPLVSIIIPTYNCDRYIEQAIKSVINQTYGNKEIIVVDDGSTDNTPQVIKPYLNDIRYFYQKNQGPSVARNRGIQESFGEFIAFLDADDFFLDNHKLSEQIACFKVQPSAGIIHSGWQRVDGDGNKIIDRKPWLTAPNLDLETWLIWNPIRPSAMIFRKQWLTKVGGFNTQLPVSEDTDLILRLALIGCEAGWLKEITVAYRQHEQNLTSQTIKIAENLLTMLDDFFALPNINDRILDLKDTVYHSKYVWLAWRFYYAGNFQKMAECLDKSLVYSPYPLTSNANVWLDNFDSISKEEGRQFDSSTLIKSPQWQKLVKSILARLIQKKKVNQNTKDLAEL